MIVPLLSAPTQRIVRKNEFNFIVRLQCSDAAITVQCSDAAITVQCSDAAITVQCSDAAITVQCSAATQRSASTNRPYHLSDQGTFTLVGAQGGGSMEPP